LSTLDALRDWVSHTDLQNFDILLCIGNKVDCIPGHPVHAEYRKRQLKLSDSSADPSYDFSYYGISQTDGSSLLGDEDPSANIRSKCLEWCIDHNIEFIEACASNADFDKCLSVDGDLQGVERLYGALSAHMWPGMVLKSGDKITEPSLPEKKEESSEEEPDYEFDYEVLSAGSVEPWDDTSEVWISASESSNTVLDIGKSIDTDDSVTQSVQGNISRIEKDELQPLPTVSASEDNIDRVETNAVEPDQDSASDDGRHYGFEDLEQLMSEIGNIRSNLRLMPDFQRRAMAAKLAMKMAAMFGGDSGGDSDDEEET
ncbi:Alpha/gamma-adaptin-binding protein p34, partial [Corchorus capsularis]